MQGWENYYVIIGAAGSTLIGIQFIVITLLATLRNRPASERTLSAFATPTVVHLAGALVIAAVMAAPWPTLRARAIAIGVFGSAAFLYGLMVRHHAKRQTGYEPTAEDWIWYVLLPPCIHAALVVDAVLLMFRSTIAGFIIAGSALALLIVGIHNAWDTVTYLVLGSASDDNPDAG